MKQKPLFLLCLFVLIASSSLVSAAVYVDDARTNFWYNYGDGWVESGTTNGLPKATTQNNWDYGSSFSTNGNLDVSGAPYQFIPLPSKVFHPSVPAWGRTDASGEVNILWHFMQWYVDAPPTDWDNWLGGPLGPYLYTSAGSGPTDGASGYGAAGPNDGKLALVRWTAPGNGRVSIAASFVSSGSRGSASVGIARYGGTAGNQLIMPRTLLSKYNLDFSANPTTNTYPADVQFSMEITVVAGERIVFMTGTGDDGFWYNVVGTAATMTFTPDALTPTSVVVTSSAQTNYQGSIVQFTATLPGLAAGSVTFLTNGVVFSTNPLNNGLAVSDATRSLPLGTTPVIAQYAGSSSFSGSTNNMAGGQVTIPLAATVRGQPSSAVPGERVNLTATLPSDATGTVTFRSDGTALGSATLDNGTALVTTTGMGLGTHTITAEYAGDANYRGATNNLVGGYTIANHRVYSAKGDFWYEYGNGWAGQTAQNAWDYGLAMSTNANFDTSGGAFQFASFAESLYYGSVPYWGHCGPGGQPQAGWETWQWYPDAPPTETGNPQGGPLGAYVYTTAGPGPTDGGSGYGDAGPNDGQLGIVRWTAPTKGTAIVTVNFIYSGSRGNGSAGVVRYGGTVGNQFLLGRTVLSKSNQDFSGNPTTNTFPPTVSFTTNLAVVAGEKVAFLSGTGNDGYYYNVIGTEATIDFTVPGSVPVAFSLANPTKLPNGLFQFGFSNTPGAAFTVFGTTDPTLPFSSWTALGDATEVSSGKFQFTDSQAASNVKRYYRVGSK